MKMTYPNYQNSILNVTCSILNYYHAPIYHPTHPELDTWLNIKQPNHIIYLLLDGLGVNVIERHLPQDAAMRRHLMMPITSVYPPTTVAATTSVISGLSPLESGHIGWVQYFRVEDTNLVVFQNKDFYNGRVPAEDLKEKYLSFASFYDQIKQASPHLETREFFPSFKEGGSETFEEQIEKVLLATHNSDASFNYVYWIEPDLSEHEFGTTSDEVATIVTSLNQSFSELMANVTEDTAVILIADHGLVDVDTIPLLEYDDIMSLLRQKPSIEPRTTTFFVQDDAHALFQERFTRHFGQWFQLYTTHEFLTSGLLGSGDIHPIYEQSLGDFVSVAIDTYMFGLHEGKGYKAHHAGLSDEEMMVPLIVYTKK